MLSSAKEPGTWVAKMLSWICVVAASYLSACEAAAPGEAKAEEPAAAAAVVRTATLEAAQIAQRIDGFASVLNPEPLIALDAEIHNATLALEFSRRQYGRFSNTPTLPLLTVEGAERQLGTDTTQLNLLEARLRHTWGDEAPFTKPDARRSLVAELSAASRAIVRMDFPQASSVRPLNVRISPLGGGPDTAIDTMWIAPSGNQAMPGVSYFGLIASGPGLRAGDRAKLTAETATRSGVVVPNASIVVSESRTWCYVETAAQKFERRAVSLEIPVADGYLVETGFEPGTKVVINGASTLLAREAEPADDDDDADGAAAKRHLPAETDDDDRPQATLGTASISVPQPSAAK